MKNKFSEVIIIVISNVILNKSKTSNLMILNYMGQGRRILG